MPARRYKTGQCRLQESLLPPRLDDYVDQGNHVRAIDAYVDSLDLAHLGFLHAAGSATQAGQPAYDPADLLKLYMYGYTNKVRSSRCLERETRRNLEVIWLLGGLAPSYKTIADFRKHNARALVRVNREFTLLCRELALFGGHTVGIDGSFFRANASKSSIHTQDKLKKQVASLEQDIEAWHTELDQNDRQDSRPDTPATTEDPSLTTKLEAMQEKLAAKQEQLQTLEASGDKQISTTDPDARRLTKRGQSVSGYNVQIAVDDEHKLIAASEVTNEGNDSHQLAPMAERAKEALDVESLTALSDAGYYESDQLKQCEDNGVTAYVAIPNTAKRFDQNGRFSRQAFTYDAERDVYLCPRGQLLSRTGGQALINQKHYHRYRSSARTCAECPLREQCLSDKGTFREIYRWEHEEVLDRHRQRMEADQEDRMRQRSALAEHPFGTLKCRSGWTHFLVRSFKKVRGEWNLMALCYNFSRVISILGMDGLMERLDPKAALQGR